MLENTSALDGFTATAGAGIADRFNWRINWEIGKYASEDAYTAGDPFEVTQVPGNLLTTAGIGRIVALLNAAGGNAITTTTARVGVGNGAGTAAIGDTDLSASAGSTNRWFNLCTVTTPSNVLTFVAVFASGDGNFAWNEFGIDISTTAAASAVVGPVLLNHKTSIAQGTKASGQVWTATATVTFS